MSHAPKFLHACLLLTGVVLTMAGCQPSNSKSPKAKSEDAAEASAVAPTPPQPPKPRQAAR